MKVKYLIPVIVIVLVFGFSLACGGGSSSKEIDVSTSEINEIKQDLMQRFDYIEWIDMSYDKNEGTLYCEFRVSSLPQNYDTILKAVYAQIPLSELGVDLYLGILDSSSKELGYLTCINSNVSVHKSWKNQMNFIAPNVGK